MQAPPHPVGDADLAGEVRNWAADYWQRAAHLPGLSAAIRAACGAERRAAQRSES